MTRSTSLFARRAFATGTLLALLGAASCQTVLRHAVAGVLEAATGEQVTVHGGNGGGMAATGNTGPHLPSAAPLSGPTPSGRDVTSVYESGPTPGWERGLGMAYTYNTGTYYTSSFFQGRCPSLFEVSLERSNDPFGPIGKRPSTLFSIGNSLNIHAGYVPLGRVVPTGAPMAPEKAWQDMNMYGQAGDGCGFAGLRLFTFGSDSSAQITLR